MCRVKHVEPEHRSIKFIVDWCRSPAKMDDLQKENEENLRSCDEKIAQLLKNVKSLEIDKIRNAIHHDSQASDSVAIAQEKEALEVAKEARARILIIRAEIELLRCQSKAGDAKSDAALENAKLAVQVAAMTVLESKAQTKLSLAQSRLDSCNGCETR